MTIDELRASLDNDALGQELHALCAELYGFCRSITGDGVRDTLAVVGRHAPLDVVEVPSGTPVLDWTVPNEWNIRDAHISDLAGNRVVDFQQSNLHVMGYSTPIRRRMALSELREHLHTLPDRPEWIPYRTSYYREDWGFCLSERHLAALRDDQYDVVIDSSLEPGALTYGELLLTGASDDEFLLSTHVCHPSLCNDNLSGISVLTLLAERLAAVETRYSYRMLFVPGTIGAITWLARNEDHVGRIRHGLVLTGLGDRGAPVYKRSRRGDTDIDRTVAHVLATSGQEHRVVDFHPYGYDERQYCSPGFDLPVGRFGRSPLLEYPEYHTSGDDLDFITPEHLADSFGWLLAVISAVENDAVYRNLSPKGEPQLGRRGLYRSIGGQIDQEAREMALLWVLNLSDGSRSLLDVAERSGLPFDDVRSAAEALQAHGLLERD